jgi:AcrR family transcriptional regulator
MSIEPLTPARRREMTRRHLLEAAATVFARDGFHGASLDDVAATAGFTKGAVYSNFASKEDLFLAVFDDRLERQDEEIRRVLDETVGGDGRNDQLPRVRAVIERILDDDWTALYLEFVLYAKRNPRARARLAATVRRTHERSVDMLESAYASVGARPEFPVPMLATMSMALFEGLGLGRLVEPAIFTTGVVTDALEFLDATLGVEPPETSPP